MVGASFESEMNSIPLNVDHQHWLLVASSQFYRLRDASVYTHAVSLRDKRGVQATRASVARTETSHPAVLRRSDRGPGVVPQVQWDSSQSPGPVAFHLLQHSGQEVRVGFKLLLNLLLCTDAAATLRQLNPFLSAPGAARVLSITGSCLMAGSRMGQVSPRLRGCYPRQCISFRRASLENRTASLESCLRENAGTLAL